MKEKKPTYYAIFKGCYRGFWKHSWLAHLAFYFISHPEQELPYDLKCRYGQPTVSKEDLRMTLWSLNNTLKQEQKNSLGEFHSRWYIHKCDEKGYIIPIKDELDKAEVILHGCA